ncbi:MAG: inositol monophosphatase [Desulfobulbus sp.]|nr:MAG: inositol monophosphatase [Desulfobulbus sp.]
MNRIETTIEHCKTSELASQLQAACRAALVGGTIIRDMYNAPHSIEMKGAINLVTDTDVSSEAAIIASLNEDTPDIAIMAEESAGDNPKIPEGKVWIIDPLDGTTNFAHGFPFFAVSIALLQDGVPQVGVVYCPMQDELFASCREGGAWMNGKRIQVTDTRFLVESLVATGFPYDIHENIDEVLMQLRDILPKVRDIRRAGAAAVDLAYVACGRLDGFWEMALKPWDTAAGWLLVTEAGGEVTDFTGKPYSPFIPEILATNSAIHKLLKDQLE